MVSKDNNNRQKLGDKKYKLETKSKLSLRVEYTILICVRELITLIFFALIFYIFNLPKKCVVIIKRGKK